MPKVGILPVWTELLEVFAIVQNTVYIIPFGYALATNILCKYEFRIAYLEIMVFALICCKDKGTNSTCLVQLALNVLYYMLAHGSCHPE